MTTCLSSPAVWRGMFGHANNPPWSFVVLACAGGSAHVAGITVPQLSGPPAPVLPTLSSGRLEAGDKETEQQRSGMRTSSKLQMRSLHLIGARDLGRADSETIASFFEPDSATKHLLECAHELPAPLRRSKALSDALETFLSSGSQRADSSAPEVATAAVAATS